jgi:DNA polymerase III epsilon subunit-like protein
MTKQHPIVAIDTETTHLSAETGEAWEVAVIVRQDGVDSEHVWQFRPLNMEAADPKSLAVGQFEDRFVVPDECGAAYTAGGDIDPMNRADALTEITAFLRNAVIVGSNPGFDDRFLRKLLDLRGEEQPWFYRPKCIANLAEGYLWHADPEWMAQQEKNGPASSRALSRRLGVEPPGVDAHQALADAKWAMRVHDAVTGGKAVNG